MDAPSEGSKPLFAAIAAGDKEAFRSLYEAHADWVFAIALRILRDRQAAEDAAQDTFLKVWRTASRFDDNAGSVRSWIGTIARNSALDLIRKRKPSEEWIDGGEEDLPTEQPDPPDLKLGRCLAQLPPAQAKAIVTMYNYGMSHSELAAHMKIPVGTVKSWIRRGTQALKACMEN